MKTFLRFLFSSLPHYYESQKQADLKIGDFVYVARPAKSFEHHWPGIWLRKLNNYVGSFVYVTDIKKHGIKVADMRYTVIPHFVLVKIN